MSNKFTIQRLLDALEPLAEREHAHETGGSYHRVCDFCGCCCDTCGVQRCLEDSHRDDCPTAIARALLAEIERPPFETEDKVIVTEGAWKGVKGIVRKTIEGNGAVKVDLEDGLSICFFSTELKYTA